MESQPEAHWVIMIERDGVLVPTTDEFSELREARIQRRTILASGLVLCEEKAVN